jgi:hypothetical protein
MEEEDVPFNDEFNDAESTTDEEEEEDKTDEPKVCSIYFPFF